MENSMHKLDQNHLYSSSSPMLSMEISMYKAGTNFLIIFFVYHATGKSMEISMYKAGTNLLTIFYFYHATGKSMEISMYEARSKPTHNLLFLPCHW